MNGKNGLASIFRTCQLTWRISCVYIILSVTDINSDRTRVVVKVCVDKKSKKLNILGHSKREIILKKEQEIAVENLMLGNDVPTSVAGTRLTMFLLSYSKF